MGDGSIKIAQAGRAGGRRQQLGRLWRLVLKELREILRDRRTIVTLVVMPILIYPLLAIVFQRFLLTSLSGSQNVSYVIGVDSDVDAQMLARQMREGEPDENAMPQHEIDDHSGKGGEHPSIEKKGKGLDIGALFPTPDITFVAYSDGKLDRY